MSRSLLLFLLFIFYLLLYMAEIDRASTRFSPILMLMYIVPGVSIIPISLFRANVIFPDRKNGANVGSFVPQTGGMAKIWAIFTGGAAHFSPPKTHG